MLLVNFKNRGTDHDHFVYDEQPEDLPNDQNEHLTGNESLEEIYPNGDIIIKVSPKVSLRESSPFYLSERTNTLPRYFKVFSQALIHGSKYFQARLEGNWPEGRVFRANASATLHLSGIDPATFSNLLNLMHFRLHNVPGLMTIDQLTALAVQVDYFQCEDVFAFLRREGYNPLGGYPMGTPIYMADARWVFVAWKFRDAELFRVITEVMQRRRQEAFDPLGLPIPMAIQDAINNARSNAIAVIQDTITARLSKLQGDTFLCSYLCDCCKLGSLIRQLRAAEIYPEEFVPGDTEFDGYSVDGLLNVAVDIADYSCIRRDPHGGFNFPRGNCHASWNKGFRDLVRSFSQSPRGLILEEFVGRC